MHHSIYYLAHSAVMAALLLPIAACATIPDGPQMTPLQIEALQTREYEAEKEIVFASVVSVFQTLGYTLDEADKYTGIITAAGLSEVEQPGFFESLAADLGFGAQSGHYLKNTSRALKATAFIEEMRSGRTRVRLSFVQISTKDGDKRSVRVLQRKIYANTFEKIGTALFVRTGQRDLEHEIIQQKPLPKRKATPPLPDK